MARSVATTLMFQGVAEKAMNRYVSLFNGAVTDLERYPIEHAFTFTPSMSIFVECESEAELDRAFAELARDGQVLMPPGNCGFSTKFGWLNDSFGVSWQLNLR